MLKTIPQLDETYYPHYVRPDSRLDITIRRYLRPEDVMVDIGAGHGEAFRYDYKAIAHVVGVDLVADDLARNQNVDERVVASVERLPFGDGRFDLAFARSVLEHLEDPRQAFAELRRVLRDGGHFIFRTPSRYHYSALAASATPHQFHQWYNERRGFAGSDTFPTRYRANTRRKLTALASQTGFAVRELTLFEIKPSYLYFHPIAYRAGIAYAHLVERTDRLQDLRANIIGVLQAV